MRIKEAIKENGLTITMVANKLNISRPALSNVIVGNPTVKNLERIANAVGCPVSDFFIAPIKQPKQVTPPKDPAPLTREEKKGLRCPYCGKKVQLIKRDE